MPGIFQLIPLLFTGWLNHKKIPPQAGGFQNIDIQSLAGLLLGSFSGFG